MDNPASNNPTYQPCQVPVDTIINTHQLFAASVGLKVSEEDKNLPYLYWTPKLHKDPIAHRFIAGSGKCSTKDLSSLLTKILTVIKNGLKRYCDVKTSHNGVNNMWILKNSKELLSTLEHHGVNKATSIQTFDFSTLYTSIPHDLLKSRITSLVHNSFKRKDGKIRYSFIKAGKYGNCYFTKKDEAGEGKYSAKSICKMIEFLIDNIYVRFGGLHFRQVIGIPMGTNCAPLLADLFLYSYETEFLDGLISKGNRKLARKFNFTYRYIDDLISFRNKNFQQHLSTIYPKELQIKPTTQSDFVTHYLDLTFMRDKSNNVSTKLYDKRDDFSFHIVNFPFLSSNIPSGPTYGVYTSQLIRYARCCSQYSDFSARHKTLVERLLSQGYKSNRLSNTFKKFYDRYNELIGKYNVSLPNLLKHCCLLNKD